MRVDKFALVICGLFLTGCALTRGQVDLRVPQAANPSGNLVVKITEVIDRRVFEVAPPKPSIPSLSEDEVNDRSVQKRAIARKRNAFGAALGDIVLPEGRTVERLVEEALAKALKESGIKVAEKGEPGYEQAIPLQADIRQFWGWFTPGFVAITLSFEAEVHLRGKWPVGSQDREVTGSARLEGAFASSSEWRELFGKGIDDLIANLKRVIKLTSNKISQYF